MDHEQIVATATETGFTVEQIAEWLNDGLDLLVEEIEEPDSCRCCGTTHEFLVGPKGRSWIGSRSGAF